MTRNYVHIAGAIACLAAAVTGVSGGLQPAIRADWPATDRKPLRLAQAKLDLDAPPADFRTSKTEQEGKDADDASKVRSSPGGVSLSVSGSVGAEMSVSTGSPARANDGPRGR